MLEMGTIYLAQGLEDRVWEFVKESYEFYNVANDLLRIRDTLARGSDAYAMSLHLEMRQKYPMIDDMLRIADALERILPSQNITNITGITYESLSKAYLRQDYIGIICDTAIKMGIKKTIRECIDHVD